MVLRRECSGATSSTTKDVRRLTKKLCLVVPVQERNLFSVKQAARYGVVSTFDMNNPRLEANKLTFPPQALRHNLYSFSLGITHGYNGPEQAMQAAANANLRHRRLGHLNCKSLDLLKNLDNNGVSFDGPVPDCNVCAVGKSHKLAHPKTADHKVKLPF